MSACPNLRETLAEAKRLGCEVERVHRTGEVRVRHPLHHDWTALCNARRKDTSRKLLALVRDAARQQQGLVKHHEAGPTPGHETAAAPPRAVPTPHMEDTMQNAAQATMALPTTNGQPPRVHVHTPSELKAVVLDYIKAHRFLDGSLPGGRYWCGSAYRYVLERNPRLLTDVRGNGYTLNADAFGQRAVTIRRRYEDSLRPAAAPAPVPDTAALVKAQAAEAEAKARADVQAKVLDLGARVLAWTTSLMGAADLDSLAPLAAMADEWQAKRRSH